MTPEQRLLVLASQLRRSPSHDLSAPSDEREVAAVLDAVDARHRTYAAATAWLETRLAKEAAEQHERDTDPLTTLRAPLFPTAPDDVVVVGCGPALPFFEFRRADGRRYIYTASAPVVCIPRSDWQLQGWGDDWATTIASQRIRLRSVLVCSAARFEDLVGTLADAFNAQPFPPDYRAGALEGMATGLVAAAEQHQLDQLVRWWRFASVNEAGESYTVAHTIRSLLAKWGQLGRIVDEAAEINSQSSGLGPTYKHYPPDPISSGSTMMTSEWAERGSR